MNFRRPQDAESAAVSMDKKDMFGSELRTGLQVKQVRAVGSLFMSAFFP